MEKHQYEAPEIVDLGTVEKATLGITVIDLSDAPQGGIGLPNISALPSATIRG